MPEYVVTCPCGLPSGHLFVLLWREGPSVHRVEAPEGRMVIVQGRIRGIFSIASSIASKLMETSFVGSGWERIFASDWRRRKAKQ